MIILALDTTTRAGSAAVLDDDRVLAVAPGDATRTHGERLPGELDAVLAAAGQTLASVHLLAVATGPGAFTGLRIGLAAMQGLAMVLGRPVAGVSALDALVVEACAAGTAGPGRVGAWMDAARGEVFACVYEASGATGAEANLSPLGPPAVGAPGDIWAAWHRAGHAPAWLVGDGAERYGAEAAPTAAIVRHPLLAPAVARLGRRAAAAGLAGLPHELQPLYVRRPDAERSRPEDPGRR